MSVKMYQVRGSQFRCIAIVQDIIYPTNYNIMLSKRVKIQPLSVENNEDKMPILITKLQK